jgi:hypothetical protein
MHSKPLGCFTALGLFAAILTSAGIMGAAIIGGNALFSAGPLSAKSGTTVRGGVTSHAQLSQDCATCHVPFWSGEHMRDRCLECHTEVQDQIGEEGTLHAGLNSPITCRSCHTEHKGAEAQITSYDSINFLHDEVGFSLRSHQGEGTEAGLACLDCHVETVQEFSVEECWECHQRIDGEYLDEHVRIFDRDCLGCHDGVEAYGRDFQHVGMAFPLEGAHLEISCEACHLGSVDLKGLKSAPQTCIACHEQDDRHHGSLGSDCAGCHNPLAWNSVSFDHAKTPFPLDGKHVGLVCEDCHMGTQTALISSECVSCHREDDSHLGGLGYQCEECHQTTGWEDAGFDHSQTHFQLEEAHEGLACNDCHAGVPLTEISGTCYSCHAEQDAHNGSYGTQCEACHQPTTWQDVTFDHALSSFPLTGAHLGLPCEQCHVGGAFQSISRACVSCHADPGYHAGLFSTACESCHNTGAWRPASFNQSHRFPINHGGRSSSCTTCHPNTLRNYTCYNCHEHNSSEVSRKHSEEGISNLGDCVRCHPTGREEGGGDD